jgi:hypothetical protein
MDAWKTARPTFRRAAAVDALVIADVGLEQSSRRGAGKHHRAQSLNR